MNKFANKTQDLTKQNENIFENTPYKLPIDLDSEPNLTKFSDFEP